MEELKISPPSSYDPPPRTDLILELIALSGDVPIDLLDKLYGSKDYTRIIVSELVTNNLIRRHQRDDKLKSLRLTKKGRNKLLTDNPERYEKILEGAGKIRGIKTEPARRNRLHRMAVAYLMMLELGIWVHRDEKAAIFEVLPCDLSPAEVKKTLSRWKTPCYYSSVEIKYLPLDSRRIHGTRALGVLLPTDPIVPMETSPYLVYYVKNHLYSWCQTNERKLMGSLLTAFNQWKLYYKRASAIMIGDNMGTLLNLMNIPHKTKTNSFYSIAEETDFEFFHFIPLDDNGKLLLRYLCEPDLKLAYEDHFRQQYDEPPEQCPVFTYHAYIKASGRYVFFGWDLDIQNMYRFRNGLKRLHCKGTILCFDFQADIYRELFGNLVDIRLLDINILRKELFDGA